jgi:hypothetical protein
MADVDELITFGADFAQARADLVAFKAELAGNPIRLQFAMAGGPGAASGAALPPAIAGSLGGGGGLGSGIYGSRFTVGNGLATTPPALAGQMAANGPNVAGGTGGGGSGVQAAGADLVSAIRSLAAQIRGAGGLAASGGMLAGASGGATVTSGTPYTQPDLNELANVQAGGGNAGEGTAAGDARQRATSGRRMGLSRLRGLFYTYGAYEGMRALNAQSVNAVRGQYAETPSDAMDAELDTISSTTSGPYGAAAGIALDIRGYLGGGDGPTQARGRAIEAKGLARATSRTRQDYLALSQSARTWQSGTGRYGQAAAGIENDYDAERMRLSEEREDASNIQDGSVRNDRMTALRLRERMNYVSRDFRRGNLDRETTNETLGYQDQAAVARGAMTSGAARRAGMVRGFAGSATDMDRQRDTAELGAFDAQEGYRVWGREYQAGSDRDVAGYNYARRPNVGRAVGTFNRGLLESEDARRSGSDKEADLIQQRTVLELAGMRRDLVEKGTGRFEENPLAVDFGQAGSTGESTRHEGDDVPEAIKKIGDLLETWSDKLDQVNDFLSQFNEKI